MNREDIEHKLLSGGEIYIDGCPTYKVTLKEMADNEFTKMQEIISLMSLDDSAASRFIKSSENVELSTYRVLVIGILQDLYKREMNESECSFLHDASIKFLSLFFKQDVCFDDNLGFVVKNKLGETIFVLDETNYSKFRNVLKYRNCLSEADDFGDDNPADEMAAKLLEKRKMLRGKILSSRRRNGESELSMADLISIFAEAESMPIQDVYCNYDIYQFNNQFNRLRIMDDYHVNIQALLAGAKAEDIKLQHWLSKINSKNDE